jgi:hypothetical protein
MRDGKEQTEIIEGMPDSVTVADIGERDKVIRVDNAFEELSSYPGVLGKAATDAVKKGCVKNVEVTGVCKDGTKVPFLMNFSMIVSCPLKENRGLSQGQGTSPRGSECMMN